MFWFLFIEKREEKQRLVIYPGGKGRSSPAPQLPKDGRRIKHTPLSLPPMPEPRFESRATSTARFHSVTSDRKR